MVAVNKISAVNTNRIQPSMVQPKVSAKKVETRDASKVTNPFETGFHF